MTRLSHTHSPCRTQAARELLLRALRGPLLPAQQAALIASLQADPRLVFRVGLAPERLPELVEHAPALAQEVLLRLTASRDGAAPYFGVLARMPLSLHSVEVVNALTGAVALPPDFLLLYVANAMGACEGITDVYVQSRLVRLVCVFVQSLIRGRVINAAEVAPEVAHFCVNFSRIREAAGLFRLLKQIEAGGAHGSGGGGAAGPAAAAAATGAASGGGGGGGSESGGGGIGGGGGSAASPGATAGGGGGGDPLDDTASSAGGGRPV